MAGQEVFDHTGTRWVVGRRWTPRWTRVDVGKRFHRLHRRKAKAKTKAPKDRRSRWYDGIDIPDLDLLLAVLAVIAFLLLLWFVVIPLMLILVDVLVVVAVFVAGVFARVFLRRPWTVAATRIDGVEITRDVVGWRASRDEITALRREIELGVAEGVPRDDEP